MPRQRLDTIIINRPEEISEEDMVMKFNSYTNAYEKANRPKGRERLKFILKYLK